MIVFILQLASSFEVLNINGTTGAVEIIESLKESGCEVRVDKKINTYISSKKLSIQLLVLP